MASERVTVVDNFYGTRKELVPDELGYDARLAEIIKKHKKNIYSITHSRDLDGIGSAAMLAHYFRMPVKNAVFTGYSAEEMTAAEAIITGLAPKDGVVILADIGMDAHMLDSINAMLDKLRGAGNVVMWFDHHHWIQQCIDGISKHIDFLVAGENPAYCATEIVYKMLCKKDEFGDALARKVHLSDFKPLDTDEYKRLEKIRFAINYFQWTSKSVQKKLQSLAKYVSKGDLENPFIEKAANAGMKISENNLQKMLDRSVLVDAGVKIAVGFGYRVVTNYACDQLIKKHGADIGLLVSKDHCSGHMRCRNESLDCSLLARAFGGNGHPQAAGFPLDKAAFGKMDAKARKDILGLVKEKAIWTYSK